MQRVDRLDDVTLTQASMVTVGMFDGVHLGHQHLIRHLVAQAQAAQQLAVVISFFPHPDVVLRGITGRYYLTPPDEKERLMRQLGVDVLVIHPFNESVRQMRAADFVDRLRQHLKLKALWATADFALGYQREGTIEFLTQQGAEKGFSVSTVELVVPPSQHQRLSSTRIREALTQGDLAAANAWLGRPYRVTGEVVHGDARGRTIGFPTANTYVWEGQIIPANGVYACWASLGDERFMAVTNVGNRPTFDGKSVTVEAHLLDFERDIYGQPLSLEFVQRLRGEQKFDGVAALVAQIGQDAQQGRAILMAP
jgi:riboflavin kinase/FMN adenylyltransferase